MYVYFIKLNKSCINTNFNEKSIRSITVKQHLKFIKRGGKKIETNTHRLVSFQTLKIH